MQIDNELLHGMLVPQLNKQTAFFGGTPSLPDTMPLEKNSFHLIVNEDHEKSKGLEMPWSKILCSQPYNGIVFQYDNPIMVTLSYKFHFV